MVVNYLSIKLLHKSYFQTLWILPQSKIFGSHLKKKKKVYLYYFLAVLGLRCCTQAFSSGDKPGLLFTVVPGFSLWWLLLLQSTGFSSFRSQEPWLSSCDVWA